VSDAWEGLVKRLPPLRVTLACGAIGLVCLGLAALPYFLLRGSTSDAAAIGSSLLPLACVFLAVKGWDWLREVRFGTYGYLMKYMAVILLAVTVVGLVPTAFWIGRFICRKTGLFALELD
jgi:hypothetical protein